jgi:hypothetical protein
MPAEVGQRLVSRYMKGTAGGTSARAISPASEVGRTDDPRARAHDERQPPFAPTDFAFAGPPLRKGPCCDAIRSSPLISEAPADRSLPPGLDPLDGPDCRTRQVVWSADGLLRPRYRAGPPAYRASSWSPADAPLGRVLLMVSAVRRRDPGRVCSLLSGGGRRELDAL